MRRSGVVRYIILIGIVLLFVSYGQLVPPGTPPLSQPIQVRVVNDQNSWTWSNTISVCAAIISVTALGISFWQGRLQRNSSRLQIFENIFTDIRATHMAFKERYEIPLAKAIAEAESEGWHPGQREEINKIISDLNDERHLTALAFFNAIEYMALLINTHRIRDEVLVKFFTPAIPYWYEEIFEKHCPDWAKDVGMFPEFRTLYKAVKTNTSAHAKR
jgi:hypothetical protein